MSIIRLKWWRRKENRMRTNNLINNIFFHTNKEYPLKEIYKPRRGFIVV
jgi:hypothetical protein